MYDLEVSNNFTLGDGTQLPKDDLITYLKQFNAALSCKVNQYRNECENLQEEVDRITREKNDSVASIRHFYKNMLYYGTSQGAKMLKASYQTLS